MIKTFKIEKIDERLIAYFEVKGSKVYDVRIEIKGIKALVNPMDCTCPFGSMYSQTTKNIEQKKICKHLKECIDLLKYMKYIGGWEYAL